MTGIEMHAADQRRDGAEWRRALTPLLTAVIVVLLGLILVGITSGDDTTGRSRACEPVVVEPIVATG